MAATQKTITPIDNSVYVERPYATPADIAATLKAAAEAQRQWKFTTIVERAKILTKAVDIFLSAKDQHAEQITRQMGRPISQSPGEMRGFEERARYMIQIAAEALADIEATDKPGFVRFVRREPLGVVFIVAPWNYPYLTSVNGVIPALMAGNAVVLKHSAQTPLCAEGFQQAFDAAGLPKGLFQHLVLTHDDTAKVIAAPEVAYCNFTGSVAGGHAVQQAALGKFMGLGLELGGKDPAYVRADANLDPCSTPASAAAPSSAFTCMKSCSIGSWTASWTSQRSTSWAIRSTPAPTSARWCALRPPSSCAARSPML